MTKQLSDSFFGDKKLTQKVYSQFEDNDEFTPDDIKIIFEPYTSQLEETPSQDGETSLFGLFNEFMQSVITQFADWKFEKFSSVVEIAAHVFEHSFEQWLSKEQSFKYFSDVVVRHSLFRPPHSVCVFNYAQLTAITTFWIGHFHRYYEYYQQCMSSCLNEVLICHPLPLEPSEQSSLKTAKIVDKSQIQSFLQ